jgi:UDP-glucose 4-epimerase
MAKKVVVTGGSGFIGSHVVDALIEAGNDVTVVDHRVPPQRSDVSYEDADILDLSSVLVATRGAEHIFHLGAEANVNYAFKYPVYSTALNVMGTTNVLEAARINGAKRVHLASTVWVYNDSTGEGAADESVAFSMNGGGHIYTTTKMTCEMLCHNYSELYGLPTTVLRYGIPYGPRMREELLIPIFLKKALAGEPLTVAGEGQQYRNFVYVRDLADAHVLAMAEVAENQTYNLEGARKVTVLEVAESIRDLVGEEVRIEFVPERAGDFGGKEISAEKAIGELGWDRSVDFKEGLERTVDWFREKWGRAGEPAAERRRA